MVEYLRVFDHVGFFLLSEKRRPPCGLSKDDVQFFGVVPWEIRPVEGLTNRDGPERAAELRDVVDHRIEYLETRPGAAGAAGRRPVVISKHVEGWP